MCSGNDDAVCLGSSPSALSVSRTSRTSPSGACASWRLPPTISQGVHGDARPPRVPMHTRVSPAAARRCCARLVRHQHPACVEAMTGRSGDPLDTGSAPLGGPGPPRTTAPLAGTRQRSSCPLPRSHDLLGRRAIPIPPGRALVSGHSLEPWARATRWAGTQPGLVHRDQVWRRSRQGIRCHGCQGAPLGTSGASVLAPDYHT
jgi:hypothetical protein